MLPEIELIKKQKITKIMNYDYEKSLFQKINMNNERILLYAFSRKGLGHVTRVARVAMSLHKYCDAKIAIASDQPIPKRFKVKGDFYRVPNANWKTKSESLLRIDYLRQISEKFKPSVLLIDYFPFCEKDVDNEIDVLIDSSKKHSKYLYVASIFRGILSGTSNTQKAIDRAARAVTDLDHLFLVMPTNEKNEIFEMLPVLKLYNSKLSFVDFIDPSAEELNGDLSAKKGTWDIVVQMGGGGEDVCERLFFLVDVIIGLAKLIDIRVLVSVGLNTPEHTFESVKLSLEQHQSIVVTQWDENILSHMNNSDIVITASGYNTCCELRHLNCYRAVLPRETATVNLSEQHINAKLFKKYGSIDLIINRKKTDKNELIHMLKSICINQKNNDMQCLQLKNINNQPVGMKIVREILKNKHRSTKSLFSRKNEKTIIKEQNKVYVFESA